MIASEHAQSVDDFHRSAAETLDRLDRTGEPEVITVDGQARAVLLSPAAYEAMARELRVSADVATIRRAVAEIDAGQGLDARLAFDELRAELLAMGSAHPAGADR